VKSCRRDDRQELDDSSRPALEAQRGVAISDEEAGKLLDMAIQAPALM
jgi:hypothetical protein